MLMLMVFWCFLMLIVLQPLCFILKQALVVVRRSPVHIFEGIDVSYWNCCFPARSCFWNWLFRWMVLLTANAIPYTCVWLSYPKTTQLFVKFGHLTIECWHPLQCYCFGRFLGLRLDVRFLTCSKMVVSQKWNHCHGGNMLRLFINVVTMIMFTGLDTCLETHQYACVFNRHSSNHLVLVPLIIQSSRCRFDSL